MKRIANWLTLAGALTGALFTSPLHAQRLSLRVANVDTDTAYLAVGDAIPLRVLGKTAAGGTVVPTFVEWRTGHCVDWRPASPPTAGLLSARDCWPVPQWMAVSGVVSGVRVSDSVYVAPPLFGLGSPRALCLTWEPAAQFYTATDTVVALAYRGADHLIAANFVPDSAAPSYHWQGASLSYQMAAIACMPNYVARDITRARGVRWASADTGAATVVRGVVTAKRRGPVVVTVDWSP